ncbi:TPA: hypothetical protein ACRQZQ_004967, partial [Escherichia coli]
ALQLGWGFRKAFSFEPVIKTPFDLLKHLAVWQLQVSNKKSKGGPNGERKELSAHPMERAWYREWTPGFIKN